MCCLDGFVCDDSNIAHRDVSLATQQWVNSITAVHRDDARATQTNVVLQRNSRTVDLTRISRAA
jgi:hypothetical protein